MQLELDLKTSAGYESVHDMVMQCWFMKLFPKKEVFETGGTNESSILRAVEEVAILDDNISLESDPREIGLVQCLAHSYLCTSANAI